LPQNGPTVFAHACRLGAEGIVSKKIDGTYRSGRAASGSKSAIPQVSPCSASGVRFGIGDQERPCCDRSWLAVCGCRQSASRSPFLPLPSEERGFSCCRFSDHNSERASTAGVLRKRLVAAVTDAENMRATRARCLCKQPQETTSPRLRLWVEVSLFPPRSGAIHSIPGRAVAGRWNPGGRSISALLTRHSAPMRLPLQALSIVGGRSGRSSSSTRTSMSSPRNSFQTRHSPAPVRFRREIRLRAEWGVRHQVGG
jgi:hypothetical protein